ncbi:MAG: hypothetical protein ACNA8R_09730 [Nitriliruptoraceae bacterium]
MPSSPTVHSPLLRLLALAATAALLLATLAAPALARGNHDAEASHRGQALGRIAPGIGPQLAQVRAATARYHDVEAAIAAGYEPASPCVSNAYGPGAMGLHYVNEDLFLEPLDPTQPQALLYHPAPNGKLRLVGVEYIDVTGTGELFGQPFTDSVPGIGENAALHVWLWQANPAGMFAAYNPNLSCPDA